MTNEEIIRLVISFLGGGLVSGIIQWIRIARSEQRTRKADALKEQVTNLYGPLCFLAKQNESYFKLNEAFHEAYKAEFIRKKYSKDKITQERLKEESSQTLSIANTYVDLVMDNNDSIVELLQNNFPYIDTDDIDIFQELVVDYTRMKTEHDEKGMLKTPLRIYDHIGEISFMRPEFIERVKRKFNQKKKELASYTE